MGVPIAKRTADDDGVMDDVDSCVFTDTPTGEHPDSKWMYQIANKRTAMTMVITDDIDTVLTRHRRNCRCQWMFRTVKRITETMVLLNDIDTCINTATGETVDANGMFQTVKGYR